MPNKLEKILEKKHIAALIIAAVTLLVYSNSFIAPFTLDDFSSISNNYAIRNPLDPAAIWKFYSNRFVLYYTLSLNYFVHQNAVAGYHIVNFLIHLINGFMVFKILFYLLGLDYFKNKIPGRFRNIICTFAALMFLTHPVQVNAVTYIVQRTASLAAAFYLAAILYYLKYRIFDKGIYLVLTVLFTVIAMFTKENTITIPFLLVIVELMFFLKDGKTSWIKRTAVLMVLFLTVPIIPATNLYLGGYSQSDPNVSFKASTSMDRFEYFYTQMNVITLYIRQLFIPDRLNFDYSNDFPRSLTIWDNYSYVSFAFLVLLGIIALIKVRKNKLISLGILWFYIGLAVESSFISIKDVYFEHRLYFPVVGFIMFLIGFIFSEFKLTGKLYLFRRPMLFFVVFMSLMIAMYSGATLYRNYIFSSGIRLWTDVTQKAPKSDRGHCILGTNYLDSYELSKNKPMEYLESAEKELKKAIELNYRNDTAHSNLSKVYVLMGKYSDAIDEANKTNNIRKSKYAYFNLGNAYKKTDRTDDAIEAYLEGYKLDKKCTFILKALGNTYNEIKDYKNAKFYYEEFLKYNVFSDNKEIKKKLYEVNKHLGS